MRWSVCVESFPGSLEPSHGDPVLALPANACWLFWPPPPGPSGEKRVFHPLAMLLPALRAAASESILGAKHAASSSIAQAPMRSVTPRKCRGPASIVGPGVNAVDPFRREPSSCLRLLRMPARPSPSSPVQSSPWAPSRDPLSCPLFVLRSLFPSSISISHTSHGDGALTSSHECHDQARLNSSQILA